MVREPDFLRPSIITKIKAKILKPLSGNSFRASGIIFIVMTLVFAIGYSTGSRNSDGPVDEAIKEITSAGQSKVTKQILQRAAIEGAIKASGDQWSNYFPTSALDIFQDQLNNQYTGVGIILRRPTSGVLEIASVEATSPAAAAGIKVSDQLIEINGTDVQGASLPSAIAMLRGNIGKKVDLLILRSGKNILVSLKRAKITAKNVEISTISKDVALLTISSFSSLTANDVQWFLTNTPHSKGIIIDLRNNPGGIVEEAVGVARQFINGGIIVSYQKASGEKVIFKSTETGADQAPLIVLINRSTASAAEILAAALQDRNRAVILGEKSYGKGTVQDFKTLNDGSKLELTVAFYRSPSGRLIEGKGVMPDLVVPESVIASKSLQVLGGLASLITPNN
jgi:carboxyl-terminal processing protease